MGFSAIFCSLSQCSESGLGLLGK